MKKLPIGIQTFAKIREENCVYMDKTPFIARLADSAAVFLSRPRRFGKSLLLDTMDCAFSGRRELFSGLYLDSPESGWNWERTSPVLRLDFGIGGFKSPEVLEAIVQRWLDEQAERHGVTAGPGEPGERFGRLLRAICEKSGKVVVLVDEYDKPILDNLEDTGKALAMRQVLRGFYGALKSADPWLRFVFLTGVTKFSKAGVFSGLNHLRDITLDPRFSDICGYTQADVDRELGPRLTKFDRSVIQRWYNGYSWGGESVYNPFDLLLLCENQQIKAWWCETGTPGFLPNLLAGRELALPDLDNLPIGSELEDSWDIGSMKLPVLMFQAGYLTIKRTIESPEGATRYVLGFPNVEVCSAWSRVQTEVLSANPDGSGRIRSRLWEVLEARNHEGLRLVMESFFSSIPVDNYRNNTIQNYGGFYASVVYGYFAALGFDVTAEDVTNRGRMDLSVVTPWGIWIFEFKVRGLDKSGDKNPLAQIKERAYAAKFRGRTNRAGEVLPIWQVGIVFDRESRNIELWELESAG